MKIAIIGAGEFSLNAIEEAHKTGATVIAVDENAQAVGMSKADEKIVLKFENQNDIINALREKNIDLCIAEIGSPHLRIVGAINEELGLPGLYEQASVYCSDKYSFHNRLRNRKLRPGHCYIVNKDNLFDPARIDYPAIFKPRYGSDCKEVHFLSCYDDLYKLEDRLWGNGEEAETTLAGEKEDANAFVSRLKKYMEDRNKQPLEQADYDRDYILEDAISGNEYGIDAMIEGCNFELILVRRKITTPPPGRTTIEYRVVRPEENLRLVDTINEYMGKVTEALGLKNTLLHADIMVQGRNCALLEISAYPAPRHIYDELIPCSTGMNLYKEFFAYIAGESHNFLPLQMKKTTLHFFDMQNCFVHHIPKPEDIELPPKVKIKKWECNMKLLDYQGTIRDSIDLDKRGYYILEGPSDKALDEAVRIISEAFEVK